MLICQNYFKTRLFSSPPATCFMHFCTKAEKDKAFAILCIFDALTASLLIMHIKVWSHYLFNVRFFQVYACLLSWAQNRKIWCRARNFLEGQINKLVENNIWFFLNDNALDNEKHQCSRSIWMPLENHNQNVFPFWNGKLLRGKHPEYE